tara:strand:- start:186 stop:494 length:309 start_codon:yes stop_codon:yes gene_type:complete
MGDFNQDAFQRLMMMPGGAAGFGMSGAGRDQSFQDYMNKKMQEDAQRRAIEMQEDQARQFQRQREQEMIMGRSRGFGAIQGAAPDFERRAFPSMGFIPGSMY